MPSKALKAVSLLEWSGVMAVLALAAFVGVRVGVWDGAAVGVVGAGAVAVWHLLVTSPPRSRDVQVAPMRGDPRFWSKAFRLSRTGRSAGALLLLSGAACIGLLLPSGADLNIFRVVLWGAAALLLVVGVSLLLKRRLQKQ